MKILSCTNARKFVNDITNFNRDDIHQTTVSKFSDGEMLVKVEGANKFQGESILVVQSLSGNVSDALLELLFALDIVNSSIPKAIYLLITYMGYSRQDRLDHINEAFSAKVVSQLLSRDYIKRLFVVDLHAPQTLGFFNVPSINIEIDDFIMKEVADGNSEGNTVLVSPDTGNVKSVISMSNRMDIDYSIAIKYRPKANENRILSLVGHDVENKDCVIVDDIVDSAGTLCNVAERLARYGVRSINVYVTHAVLSGNAVERIANSHITKLHVSNSIDCAEKIKDCNKIEVFSIADYCLGKILKYTY